MYARRKKKKKKNKSFSKRPVTVVARSFARGGGCAKPFNEGNSAPVPVKSVFSPSKRRKLFLCVIYRLRLESGSELKVHQNLHVSKFCCIFAAEFKNAYTYGYN